MRKLITLVLLSLAVNAAYPQSNVPNGDFETWYTVPTLSGSYEDIGAGPTDNWLSTLNSLAAVPPTAGGPGPLTAFKTDDKYSGLYAAKAVSANFPLGMVNIFIPGMIGTAIMDMVGVRALLGRPCADCRPLHFKGYYKFEPVNGDSCIALILLSKWNSAQHKRDTIGYGQVVIKNPVDSYTLFDVPVNYVKAGNIDSMTLLVISSAGFNVIDFLASQGQAGSTMYIDALSLEYPAGIEQVLMPEIGLTLFPNPARETVTVTLSRQVTCATLDIYTAGGKHVSSVDLTGLKTVIPVYSYSNGTYYYKLKEESKLLNSGSFVISR